MQGRLRRGASRKTGEGPCALSGIFGGGPAYRPDRKVSRSVTGRSAERREQDNSETRRRKNRLAERQRHFSRSVEQLSVAEGAERDRREARSAREQGDSETRRRRQNRPAPLCFPRSGKLPHLRSRSSFPNRNTCFDSGRTSKGMEREIAVGGMDFARTREEGIHGLWEPRRRAGGAGADL